MGIQPTVFSLNREEVLGLQQIEHELQVTRIGMARYTQVLGNQLDHATSLVNHIFHTRYDCFLGNRWRCNDINQISVFDFYITVTTDGHLAQTVNGLAHPTRLQDNQLMVFKLRHFLRLDQQALIRQG